MNFHNWLTRIVKRQKGKDTVPVDIVEGNIDVGEVDIEDRENREVGIVTVRKDDEYNWNSTDTEPSLSEEDIGATGYIIDEQKVLKWDGSAWVEWMDMSEEEAE